MTAKPAFGRPMRASQFLFSPTYTPLNHGSYGASPRQVQEAQHNFQKQCDEKPSVFFVYDLPNLISESRKAIAPLLGVGPDEVVFVPNASTGVDTVLRNLKWERGDVVVHFGTIYDSCEAMLASIKDHEPLETVNIQVEYPIKDEEILRRFRETVERVRAEGKNVRLAMFDTVLTFPGVRVPWEELVGVCKELGVLSLIDGAHGVGLIDLRHLGEIGPDFFVSNCHKWLYTPRSCAVFYVPFRNQQLIRSSLPTSYRSEIPPPDGQTQFVHLFDFVATYDYSPYLCVPAALEFRNKICGGKEAIRTYCYDIARQGGRRAAETLGTEVMGTGFEGSNMTECCFVNVRLPLKFKAGGEEVEGKMLEVSDTDMIKKWINVTAIKEFGTYLQIALHANALWVRLSAQIYLDVSDFEWVGHKLKQLCERVEKGDVR